jgi:hypothetical protein
MSSPTSGIGKSGNLTATARTVGRDARGARAIARATGHPRAGPDFHAEFGEQRRRRTPGRDVADRVAARRGRTYQDGGVMMETSPAAPFVVVKPDLLLGPRAFIDHPPGTHDDIANAVAGAICRAH